MQRQADWELLLEQSQERMAMQLDAATRIQKVSMVPRERCVMDWLQCTGVSVGTGRMSMQLDAATHIQKVSTAQREWCVWNCCSAVSCQWKWGAWPCSWMLPHAFKR